MKWHLLILYPHKCNRQLVVNFGMPIINKRSFLGSSGILQRRQRQMKRKRQSDHQEEEDGEKTNDNACIATDT
ncbi:hypothetical protein DOY81_009883 [Sarcophaga bullata]|nr:hypothetical protein DOY81_009883 [Sarcophaga bullata]